MTAADAPGVQRGTPLAAVVARRIAATGPLPVREFMALCLADPEHGYYRSRVAIGRTGDFITAPEISQVFGELLGLWAAVAWQQMGAPAAFQLVEIGPGRGTLMRDALRAARLVPGFTNAVDVVLVEPNPVLREAQEKTLAATGVAIRWHEDLDGLAEVPTVLLANEFLDVIPVTQLVRCAGAWHERAIVRGDAGRLAFGTMPSAWTGDLPSSADAARQNSVLELRDLTSVATALSGLARAAPLAALFIDYGHETTGFGDTLQAVRNHRPEHPLVSPGEADLTAMVDFEAATAAFRAQGLIVERLLTQAEFLGSLGIAERASRLMAANASRAGEIETGIARLMSPEAMGTRFKVLGVRGPDMAPLPGFPAT